MEYLKIIGTEFVDGFKLLVYCADPKENVFERVEDVPSYDSKALPVIAFLIVFEQFLNIINGKPFFKMNDALTSSTQGMLLELTRLWTFGIETIVYTFIYNHFRIFTIDPYAFKTWLFCMFASDLAYYVIHRLIHEVNILWAIHQVHHSSEHYNMTTAIRLQILRPFTEWIAHLPMALAIPPPLFFVHYELHLLTQVLIHFNAVGKLGYLDYVFNSPSNHRVHHGRNRRCIDKNFGGILMIWDHLFGTYEHEGNEPVDFGLTSPIKTFNPFYIQFHPFLEIWKKFWNVDGIWNKISVFLKGPGWSPGSPRLGNVTDIPEVIEEQVYDPKINAGTTIYAISHFFIFLGGFTDVMYFHQLLDDHAVFLAVAFLFFSATINAFLFDGRLNSPIWEIIRCSIYLLLEDFCLPFKAFPVLKYALKQIYIFSLFIWLFVALKKYTLISKYFKTAVEKAS